MTTPEFHGTTILLVRKGKEIVIAGDGQATVSQSVVIKSTVDKLREFKDGAIIAGFAGSTSDGMTLFERLETKLEESSYNLIRAAVELSKDWRTDKYLRRLEAMMIVADKNYSLLITGSGDVMQPDDGIIAIGSGGNYALAAARALIDNEKLSAEDVVDRAMKIAGDLCVFTNHNVRKKMIKL